MLNILPITKLNLFGSGYGTKKGGVEKEDDPWRIFFVNQYKPQRLVRHNGGRADSMAW